VSVLYEDELTLTEPRRFAQTLAVTLLEQAKTAELLLESRQVEDLLREAGDRIALPSIAIARAVAWASRSGCSGRSWRPRSPAPSAR